ncbi:cilia- and flagella-associated protein 43-like [Clavelina lepadiformis]|uniref:Cilia- and flagella-associated protein 43 n=1 Tax=Clavelina lepadiformis TaxID=159417 RepID=A0ABP0FP65_CLALP
MEHYGSFVLGWAQGYKGDQVSHIDPENICYACGNVIKFIDVISGSENVFKSPGNGITKIATSPTHGLFAVAESGLNPRIFVCRYPSFEVACVLEGGANLEYSQIAFSISGSYIAACSGIPDFSIYVWEWTTGKLKCSEKLLSEDSISSLLFNPLNQHQISLMGPNKVTLWSIQECNNIATLKGKKVPLPTSDGIILEETDDTPLSRTGTRLGFNVSLPASTTAGLTGEKATEFVAPELRHARVTPTSQCWSSRSDVYIGCTDGQLFRVNGDNGHPSLLLGGVSDQLLEGDMEPGMFSSIALNSQGLIAGGVDGCLRTIRVDNNGIKINDIWKGSHPINFISFSPGVFVELVYGSADGSIHRFNTVKQQGTTVASTKTGQFVGVSYSTGGKFCVTCREEGELQVWESETGFLVANVSLCTRITSVACCPSAPVAAVGTWTGHICYVDLSSLSTEEADLRQVDRVRMHHGPVNFLRYDPTGKFLLSACAEENEVFVIDAKPTLKFACIGYVDCGGAVKDLSIHHQPTQSNVVAVVGQPHETDEALSPNAVVIFSLSSELISKPDKHFQSRRQNFKDGSINCCRYQLSEPIDCAVITKFEMKIELAALSATSKKLLRFEIFQGRKSSSEEEVEVVKPASVHRGHELNGGVLVMSSHGSWLASASSDGSIIFRDLLNWNSIVVVLAHSFMDGGVRAIALSPEAHQIVSVGTNDASLVAFNFDFKSKGRLAAGSSFQFARNLNMQLRSDWDTESEAVFNMDEWSAQIAARRRATSIAESSDERPGDALQDARPASVVQSEVTMTPTPTPAADGTWLDAKVAIALKEENAKYDEVKRELRKSIKELRKTILSIMETNENLPELEQLRHDEYNLDTDEQKRMQVEQNKQVEEVREEIHFENLAQKYLAFLIKKECWDDMVIKGRALKTFSTSVSVNNYPLRPILSQETNLLQKITQLRKIEIAENVVRKSVVEASASLTSTGGEEEEEDEDTASIGLSLHGSLGPKYSGDNKLFYSQFDLHTREEKIAQVVLVKDAIRRIKEAFNEAFSNVYKNKDQEITRIKERNVRIRAIMQELDMDDEAVMDPSMDEDEMPEKVFEVKNAEVTVERVLSEEQIKEKEEQERLDDERKAAAKGDNKRERALGDMMGGVLEVKKEDILKQDIPPPDFAEEKLEKDWSEEEKKKMKEYEKKLKDLQEEREKYRKNLENELKKLQQSNIDGMASFDETLVQLFNRKVKIEMVVNQEELKILRLTSSVTTNDELNVHEKQLNYLHDLKSKAMAQSSARVEEIRKIVDEYQEVYDNVVAEDKLLDRAFKREFSDVPLSVADQLYKLFKRRPRVQRQRNLADRSGSLDPYGMSDRGSVAQSVISDTSLNGLSELDDESNMPEGVDVTIWTRLCVARRTKVESEIRVRKTALTLAEMTQYLQHRVNEDESLRQEIDDIIKQQTKLCEDFMKNTLNLEVQFLLKQGQVEVVSGTFTPDYSDSILIHRGVVEDLNGTIRALGEGKVAAMTESKDFKKGIHQLEWERKRMIMKMEDLHNRARHIQMLKLTKDLQAFLNEENHSAKQAKQMAVLEQTLAMQDKQLDKNLSQRDVTASHLSRTIRLKEHENKELDKVLEELHVSVSERQNISQVNAAERAKNTADKRLRGIVQRRKLVDLAKAQAQEVAVLRAEVERLRMKTFPALVQVER